MKRFVLILALLALPACHAPVTITTPAGQAAYAADQVVQQLGILSKAVIADTGNGQGQIRPADAFKIIVWISGDAHAVPPTIGVVQIAATTAGQGWKAAAKQGWTSTVRPILLSYPTVANYVPIVDALLEMV